MARIRHSGAVALVAAVLAAGCFVEVSNSESTGLSGDLALLQSADRLAAVIELQFEAQTVLTTGATVVVACPEGLSGEVGHRFMCIGQTSDGFALKISVWEPHDGGFEWQVTDSPRIAPSDG